MLLASHAVATLPAFEAAVWALQPACGCRLMATGVRVAMREPRLLRPTYKSGAGKAVQCSCDKHSNLVCAGAANAPRSTEAQAKGQNRSQTSQGICMLHFVVSNCGIGLLGIALVWTSGLGDVLLQMLRSSNLAWAAAHFVSLD